MVLSARREGGLDLKGLVNKTIFATKRQTALAIDIGSSSIKYIKMDKGHIVDYGVREIMEIFDIPSILKELTKDFSPSQVFSFVSGPAISIRTVPFPKMSQRELKDAIMLRLDKYSPFTLDESILDFKVISDIREAGVIKDNVMVVAARRDVVSEHIATFKKAGLEPTTISVVPFALVAAARRFARLKPDEVVCMLDIGSQFTNILFIRNQKLDLARTITIAGNAITEAMTVALSTEEGELALSTEDAENLKRQYGIPNLNTPEKLPNGIGVRYLTHLQEAVLTRMVAEINRSIDYYRREFTISKIDRVLLCGGCALLKGLKEYIGTSLAFPTEIFDPFRTHNLYRRDQPFAEGLGTRLVGTLGVLYDASAIDLLPQELKFQRARSGDIKKVVSFALLVVPALVVINILIGFQTNIKKRNIDVYKRRIAAFEMINAEYFDIKTDVTDMQSKLKTLNGIIGTESSTLSIMQQLSYIVPQNIQLITLSVTRENGIKMTGMASGQPFLLDLDLAQFMIQLEAASQFRNVQLINKTRTVLQGETILNFEISCTQE